MEPPPAAHGPANDRPGSGARTPKARGGARGAARPSAVPRGDSSRERLLAAHEIAIALDESQGLEEAGPRVLQAIGTSLGWDVGVLWLVDDSGEELRARHAWRAADAPGEVFVAASLVRTFTRGIGLPGRVWVTGQPLWVPDVTVDSNFPRAPIARAEGLHGAFGFPLVARGKTFGVIEFFSREIRRPDDALLKLVATAGRHLGQFHARNRAEERLADRAIELSDFFENAPMPLHWVGPDGVILRVNRAELALLGYERDEVVGRSIADFHADAEAIATLLARLTAGEPVDEFAATLRHKDGSMRHVLVTSNVYREDGRFVHTRCFTRDVTERKASEDALRTSEERKRLILAHALDAYVAMDSRGVVLEWNPRAETIFGWTADEAVGRSLVELIIPESHRKSHGAGLARFLATGDGPILGEKIETTGLRKGGLELPVELAVTAVRVEDSWTFHAFVRDITNRRRLNEGLRTNERASRRRAEAYRRLALATARPDAGFYDEVVEALAGGLDVRDVLLLRIESAKDGPRLRTLARWTNGVRGEPYGAPLSGTLAESVVRNVRTSFLREDVANAFPDDALLRETEAWSGVAAPIRLPGAEIRGVLLALDDEAIDGAAEVEALVETFAACVAPHLV